MPWRGFAQQHRSAAESAEQLGHWAQVLWHLDVLLALTPADAELQRRRTQAELASRSLATDRQQRARLARTRGDLEGATRLYLEALAMAPGDAESAEALRGLERERVRRQHLGQLSRNTLTRRMGSEPTMVNNGLPPLSSGGPGRNELEHASLLASQGEVDGAIVVLRPLLASRPTDPAVRRLLADLYYRQAEALLPARRDAAIAALENAVQADAAHARASARLKELKADNSTQGSKTLPVRPARPATP